MPARLNIFQRTMLHWDDLHPYNALHAVRVARPFNPESLAQAINGTLEFVGLTNLTVNRPPGTFRYHGGPTRSEIKTVNPGTDAHAALTAEIERQLNCPFTLADRFNPFRFFVVPQGDGFFLGLVYYHAVADGESVVHLLRQMLEAYAGRAKSGEANGLEIHPPRWDRLLRQHPLALASTLGNLPAHIHNLRRSCRPPYRDAADGRNRFVCFSLAPEELRGLIGTAKSLGITVNDLLLALLLKCLSPLASGRRQSPKRPKLSVGCIVNLRKELALDGPRTFGLFLGAFMVHHEVPEGIGVPELAGDINRQTSTIKRRRLFLGVTLDLACARRLLPFFSTERRKKLYQKNYPLWGGITNMNLNSVWGQAAGNPPEIYYRTVSTGPVTPLVLSFTTVRNAANLALTYRSTVFSAAMIDGLKRNLLDLIRNLSPVS